MFVKGCMSVDRSFTKHYAEHSYCTGERNSDFIPRLIYQHIKGKRILDIGCGPLLHILGLFVPEASTIVGLDIEPGNVRYVKEQCADQVPSEGQNRAFECLAKISSPHIARQSLQSISSRISIVLGDALQSRNEFVGAFDNVMQIGCFGCFDAEDSFVQAATIARSYLKPGGVFLSVNWLNESRSSRPNHFDGELSAMLTVESYRRLLTEAGFSLVCLEESDLVTAASVRNGFNAIVWALGRA